MKDTIPTFCTIRNDHGLGGVYFQTTALRSATIFRYGSMTDSDGSPIVTSSGFHKLRGVPSVWVMSLTASAYSM